MRFLFLLFLSVIWSSQSLASDSIELMTEEFAPYQFYAGEGENKKITGISIEIVQALQNKVGNRDQIEVLPWSRALKLVSKKPNRALFSTARTPEREDKFKWVGPLSKLEMVFFKKKGTDVMVDSLEAAREIPKIGVTKNVATHEILTNMGFTNLDVLKSGSDDKNLRRLTKGRVDVWPTAYYAGIYSAKKEGLLDQIEAIPDVSIMSGFLYIAFNKETDSRIIYQWQTALDELKDDGVIDAILKKYDR
ncbi:ABC transporter substrate-binding protein [Magnetospira sp. QH-2]|uniref:substrate-binding periplasmic protein n=1 Tax=Magnetospira sp. (strain QH-2) TaxID=1288970 RepID=UPI0003E81504|nr:transporter substrate-binding domain-containing protein [Magnetospira sp. QH-2]CCQ75259.1 putative ABC transporter, periplasmic component [Magnetospira sp. QH-2]